MSPSREQPTKEHFGEAVDRAFSYLVSEFAFRREPMPDDPRDIRVAYSSPAVRIVVEGTNWGLNTRVALGRSSSGGPFENFDLLDLVALRGASGESAPARGTIKRGSTQLEQIPYYARVLRAIGQDILVGDFSVFPALHATVEARARSLK